MSQKRKQPMPSLESMQVETLTREQNLVQTIGTAHSQIIDPTGQSQSISIIFIYIYIQSVIFLELLY